MAEVRARRLKPWKTKPSMCRRRSVNWVREKSLVDMPWKRYSPEEGTSSPPMMFMQVDLPEPDGPMIATNSPTEIDRSTLSSARMVASPSP